MGRSVAERSRHADGKTASEKPRGVHDGPVILLETKSSSKQITFQDETRLHQFGAKIIPAIFVGYVLHAGGRWARDLLIADW